MDAQCQVRTVDLEDLQNVGNLDLLCVLLRIALYSDLRCSIALDSKCIVNEYQDAAQNCSSDAADRITDLGFAQSSQNLRQDHHTDNTTDGGTKATGRGQGCAFSIVGSHDTQQGAHADVHDGIAQLENDLGNEQNNDAQQAVKHGGHDKQRNHTNSQNGDGAQDPGAELVGLVLCLCEHNVHKGTDQGIVDCIPNIPNNQNSCINSRINTQNVTGETLQVADHHQHTHAASVSCTITNVVHGIQLGDRGLGFCHYFFLLILFLRQTNTQPHNCLIILTNCECIFNCKYSNKYCISSILMIEYRQI